MKLLVFLPFLVSLCNSLIAQHHRRLPIESRQFYIGSLQFQKVVQPKPKTARSMMDTTNQQQIVLTQYNKNWLVHRMLGEGASAKVYLVQDSQTTEFKVLKKYSQPHNMKRQHSILAAINQSVNYTFCPVTNSTISISHYSQSSTNLSEVVLSEREVKILMYKLVFMMQGIHQKGVIHSDIKVGNVLIDVKMKKRQQTSQRVEIEIIDWNLAKTYYPGKQFSKFQGTPKYMAPELLIQHEFYTPAVDVWSAGMLMFRVIANESMIDTDERQVREIIKLFGYKEFKQFYSSLNPKSYSSTLKEIEKSKQFTDSNLDERLKEGKLTQEQRNFIKKMITLQPQNRPSFEELLSDQYFADVRQFYEPGYYKAQKKNAKQHKNQKNDH